MDGIESGWRRRTLLDGRPPPTKLPLARNIGFGELARFGQLPASGFRGTATPGYRPASYFTEAMILDPSVFRRLCRARDFLAEPSDRPPSIAAAAREAGMSTFHFIRQFQSLFGVTPHQFRIDHRIRHAKRLLAGGQLSVTETCMQVGMSSLGSFSVLFRRRVGESPSSYRRRRLSGRAGSSVPTELFPGCLSLWSKLPPDAII